MFSENFLDPEDCEALADRLAHMGVEHPFYDDMGRNTDIFRTLVVDLGIPFSEHTIYAQISPSDRLAASGFKSLITDKNLGTDSKMSFTNQNDPPEAEYQKSVAA